MNRKVPLKPDELERELESIFDSDSEEDPFHNSDTDDPEYSPGTSPSSSDDEEIFQLERTETIISDQEYEESEGEQNGNNDKLIQIKWGPHQNKQQQFIFTGQSGIQLNILPTSSPLDIFMLFVTDEIFEYIAEETNRYAHQVLLKSNITRASRLNQWQDINSTDIKHFFGIIMWMGLNVRPQLSDYWSKLPIYENHVSKIMPRNQFELIMTMFHFSDNNLKPEGDRLFKISPLVDKLHENFQQVYTTGQEMVIDETMVPWRGRLSFRQYIPGKKHKYGVKLFKICSTTGYTWKIQIYAGAVNGKQVGSVAERVVLELCDGLLDEGRTLFTDNFYTGVQLSLKLLKRKTHLVGTLRKNRKNIPTPVLNRKLQLGEVYGEENAEGVTVLRWKAKKNKEVLMLSTKHNLDVEEIRNRKRKRDSEEDENEEKEAKKKPVAIIDYNKGKCGIDKSDQMSSYATSIRRGIKWYRKVAVECLTGISIVNAHLVFRDITKNNMSITKFREEVCMGLLGIHHNSGLQKVKVKHVLRKRTGAGTKDRKNCNTCYNQLIKTMNRNEARVKVRRVKTYCDGCPESPTMCFECYTTIHSEKDGQ